jgi:hypothetical protein
MSVAAEELPSPKDLKRTESAPDAEISKGAVPSLEEKLPESGFTTTRKELWSFYVYYIVCFPPCSALTRRAQAAIGQQWPVRLQLRALPVPEPLVPGWVRPHTAGLLDNLWR